MRRFTLAGQLLVLQTIIVLVVVIGVGLVTLAQERARFEDTEGRRARATAEAIASSNVVRQGVLEDGSVTALRVIAEGLRTASDSSYAVVVDDQLTVLASTDPALLGTTWHLQGDTVDAGRGWSGVAPQQVDGESRDVVIAEAPVMNADLVEGPVGEVIGAVQVGRSVPTVGQTLSEAAPTLLTYLGLAGLISVLGSFLIARRVRRQTLGLEPQQIVGLVEHRDATLHSIREGVVALDLRRRVTLVNDEAVTLLGLPSDAVGRSIDELPLDPDVVAALTGTTRADDQVLPVNGRLLILNSEPTVSRGQRIGSVTTLRDRTELMALQRELDVTRHATDTLRAQAHEFSNRLHTIAGLIELEEYGEVGTFVRRLDAGLSRFTDEVVDRVEDPSVAALLIAKNAQAHERGIRLVVSSNSALGRIDDTWSTDVSTVVGNLVDNAFDALAGDVQHAAPVVEVELIHTEHHVRITVRDNGPGVDPAQAEQLFRRGFSTKDEDGERGIGLSLVRLVCRRRGGQVTVHNEGGAVFVATLPDRLPVAS